jgi:hypothetical protein
MTDYSIYIEDDRYQVPTLRFLSARDEGRAREQAHSCLEESAHHLSVEVCHAGAVLFRLTRAGCRVDSAPSSQS